MSEVPLYPGNKKSRIKIYYKEEKERDSSSMSSRA